MCTELTYGPILSTTDWNEEWMQLQTFRRRADSAEKWDQRAANFGNKDVPSNYVTKFFDLLELDEGDSVFDMGCGNGGLAIPLAQRGHHVYACDFSRGMLDYLEKDREAKGLTDLIDTKLLSWADNWEACGVADQSVDVAIASRSIATENLKESLMKLGRVARKKACITLTTGNSPRTDERVLEQLGLGACIGRDYLYAFNILAQAGLKPRIDYIESKKDDCYDSYEEALEALTRMVRDATFSLDEKEQAAALDRLAIWLNDELVPNDAPGPRYKLSHPRCITWAFITYSV